LRESIGNFNPNLGTEKLMITSLVEQVKVMNKAENSRDVKRKLYHNLGQGGYFM